MSQPTLDDPATGLDVADHQRPTVDGIDRRELLPVGAHVGRPAGRSGDDPLQPGRLDGRVERRHHLGGRHVGHLLRGAVGLERQQDGQVGIVFEDGHRLGRQLAGAVLQRPALGIPTSGDGGEGEHRDDDEGGGEAGDDQAAGVAPAPSLGVGGAAGVGEEVPLGLGQLEGATGRPGFGLFEAGTGEQVAGLPPGLVPLAGGGVDAAADQQIAAGVVDPAGEPLPLPQDGLVGDLDGRTRDVVVAVEGQQPARAEGVEHGGDHASAAGELVELAATHPAPGVLAVLVDGDQPDEHVPGRRLRASGRARGRPPRRAGRWNRPVLRLPGTGRGSAGPAPGARTARPACTRAAAAHRARRPPRRPSPTRRSSSTTTPTWSAGRRTASASSETLIACTGTMRSRRAAPKPASSSGLSKKSARGVATTLRFTGSDPVAPTIMSRNDRRSSSEGTWV